MDLSDIVSVSGFPGLYRLKSHTNDGFIVQSLEDQQIKFIRNIANRLVPLDNITIFTTEEDDIELEEVFKRMLKQKDDTPPIAPKSSEEELRDYFETIVPEHDENQVYGNDIKKAIQWYQILREHEILTEDELEEKSDKKSKKKKKKSSGKKKKGKKKSKSSSGKSSKSSSKKKKSKKSSKKKKKS
jgi:hypothetical protein